MRSNWAVSGCELSPRLGRTERGNQVHSPRRRNPRNGRAPARLPMPTGRRKLHWPSICGGCRRTTTPIPTPPTTRCASTRRCIACPTAAISCPAMPTAWPSTRTRPPIPPTRSASSRPSTATACSYEHHTTSLVFNDPPLHTRVRRIIAGALHAARHRRHGGARGGAGRRPARRHGRQGQRRPDRRPRRRRAGGGDRQPAGGAARRARTAARLVAGDPGRARAGADARSSASAASGRSPSSSPTCAGWSPTGARIRAIPSATC